MTYKNKLKKFWKSLGPGLITGASDDEPSGITTYFIAGARYGIQTLWLSLWSLPLMISIQEMSARIGRVSGKGLAGNMKQFYPRWVLLLIGSIVITVNTANIGADIAGMADALALITPYSERMMAVLMTVVIIAVTVVLPYQKIFMIFKWLSLSLFAYIAAVFWIDVNWLDVFKNLFIPTIKVDRDFFLIMAAFLGTTIAPYMFFWQANQEVEERLIEQCKPGRICRLTPVKEKELENLKVDTRIGMTFSNTITFFIIVLADFTIFKAGINNIETLRDAAEALRPLAGDGSYLLFTLGILSSGFLAIPILAGSAAYVISEIFNLRGSLNKTFTKAKEFYTIIIISTLIGLLVPLLGLDPVKALFYTAILYAIVSPVIIFMIIHMANNEKIMKEHVNGPWLNTFGYITFIVMAFVAIVSFFTF